MKITKKQLRKLVMEQVDDSYSPGPMYDIEYLDPMTYMDKIDDMDDEFQDLMLGSPFKSAGVRMALEEMQSAFLELGKSMRAELEQNERMGR